MSAIYDSWEKLVAAVLRREELWELFHSQSRSPSVSSGSSSFSVSCGLGSASPDDVPIGFSRPEWPAVDRKEDDGESKPAASTSEIGETCARKEIILSFDAAAKQSARMFEKEMALLSRLKHPNIVQFYGIETAGDILYMYFEYVSGDTICMILQEYGNLTESAIRSYTQQILSGLAYLHSNGIAHRDIRCANVLVDSNGRAKLCNYGIEKHIAGKSHSSLIMDSAYWTAPEVIRNSNARNLSSDIWSLGCTVVEMATSKAPLSLRDMVVGMFKVANKKEHPAIPDHFSYEANDFLRHCFQWNPVHRPTASQLLEHPFVKASSRLGKQIPVSTSSDHHSVVKAVKPEGTDYSRIQRIRHQLNSSPQSNFHSRNTPASISPIGSPLPHPRSPQHLKGKISPPSQTTSDFRIPPIDGIGVIL